MINQKIWDMFLEYVLGRYVPEDMPFNYSV